MTKYNTKNNHICWIYPKSYKYSKKKPYENLQFGRVYQRNVPKNRPKQRLF